MKKGRLFVAALVVAGAYYAYTRYGGSSGTDANSNPQVTTAQVVAIGAQNGPTASMAKAPVVLSPDEALFEKGKQAAKSGDTRTAQEAFGDLMKRLPGSPIAARAAVEMGLIYKSAGDTYNERNLLSVALPGLDDGNLRGQVVEELNRLNGELVFSKKAVPDSLSYQVKSGDSLSKIGGRLRITAEFIKRINYRTDDRINVGESLKVFQGPFDVVVEKSKFRLTVYRSGIFIKEYAIGIGDNGSTPEGEFVVENKLVDPVWNPPGAEYAASKAPDNPLGTRWIGFNKEYGIHGTIEPDSIGKAESRGCVRMLNANVEEVYDLLVIGSKVVVRP